LKRSHFLAGAGASLSLLWGNPAWATAALDDGPDPDGPDNPNDGPPAVRRAPAAAAAAGLAVRVRVANDDSLRYRGNLSDLGDARVNTLALEEYLLGVIPEEMPSSWPQAALEAQAIVARTYALRKRNAAISKHPYDLVAGTADQMYGGIAAERPAASNAVSSTSGMIVTYDGALADVAYMSCCGGHTEDSQRLWGSNIPYLHGVSDPYCSAAPSSSWNVSVDWNAVSRSLHMDDAPLQSVQLIGNPGSRPTGVRFVAEGGSQEIDIRELQHLIGKRFPSTYLRTVNLQRGGNDETVVLQGSGNGHGVGLCQWGARGMALAGANAAQILAFYFPSTGVGHISSIT
jgi:stage II sporulation protein D